jgi:8-oxo-dGTP pyrophosphatase MutT (NUDIX family)
MDDWKVEPFEIVYAREPFPTRVKKSIFLAGPTPREAGVAGWRLEALATLKTLGFDGHVFLPEPRDGQWLSNYDEQIDWEEEGLNRADVIIFWVPREFPTMPALTTNIEWGEWKASGKVLFGAPSWAKNIRYIEYYARKLGVPSFTTLQELLNAATTKLGDGAERTGGECQIPLHVWQKKEFQGWLQSQKQAGNRLDGARVIWSFFPKPGLLLSYALRVDVHVTSEKRNKSNEFILARPDVSSVLLYRRSPDFYKTRIVLVREFRSTVRNQAGFVYELPGGSSVNELTNPLGVAAEEVREELGIELDHRNFKRHETRQNLATVSIYQNSLFSCELTAEQIARIENDEYAHGDDGSSERTYAVVKTVEEMLTERLVDWAQLGMIFSALKP